MSTKSSALPATLKLNSSTCHQPLAMLDVELFPTMHVKGLPRHDCALPLEELHVPWLQSMCLVFLPGDHDDLLFGESLLQGGFG